MQILAGSLNVEVGSFLHAGYISACPRTFQEEGSRIFATSKAKLIDIKKAVELKGPKDHTAHVTAVGVVSPTLPSATMASGVCELAIATLFFAFLIGLYYRRMRKIAKPSWKPLLFAGAPIVVLVVVIYYLAQPIYEAYRTSPTLATHSVNDLPRPWEGVPIQEYRDPQAATEAIQRALIATGLLGAWTDVRNLAAIQDDVAFPVTAAEYTPGMKYSQKTYGRDGWGREFSFEKLADCRNRITSAGPDGKFGTSDDVVLVTPAKDSDWERNVGGMYVRTVAGREIVLIHQIGDTTFLRAHAEAAKKLTGTDQFDMFHLDELARGYRDPARGEPPIVAALKNRHKFDSAQETSDELLFVQFEGSTHE
jgi:hypothetical protein